MNPKVFDTGKITNATKTLSNIPLVTFSFCVRNVSVRENHQPDRKRIGKKGFASLKWIVGGKFYLLTNRFGPVTDWSVKTANVSDQAFLPLVEAVAEKMNVLADTGFRRAADQVENLKICRRGNGTTECWSKQSFRFSRRSVN